MAIRRYARSPILKLGKQYGTYNAARSILLGIESGTIRSRTLVMQDAERLDTLAGEFYGDSRLWWVIAAASEIGWGLQVPPGTELQIPDINDVAEVVG